jgi:hypothetical protein
MLATRREIRQFDEEAHRQRAFDRLREVLEASGGRSLTPEQFALALRDGPGALHRDHVETPAEDSLNSRSNP